MQTINFFAQEYVNVSDMMQLQSVPQGAIKDILACLMDKGIVSGVAVTPTTPGSQAVLIAIGKFILEDGSDVTTTASTTLSLASFITALTAGQSQWVTIYAVPLQISDTPVVTPSGTTVNYRTYDSLSFQVVAGIATTGTPAKSSTPPAGYTGVLVADVLLTSGLTNIVTGDIDQTRMLGFTNIPAILASIAGLQTQVNTIDAEIATIDTTLVTLQDDLNTINATLTTIAGEITTIDGTLATYATHLSTIDGEITALQNRATADEANITANTNSITTLNGEVSTLQGQMTTADTNITALEAFMAGFTALLNQATAAGGYFKVPCGAHTLIVQWGPVTLTEGTQGESVTSSFPLTFPNACLVAMVQANGNGADLGAQLSAMVISWNASGVTYWWQRNADHGGNTPFGIVIAIGY